MDEVAPGGPVGGGAQPEKRRDTVDQFGRDRHGGRRESDQKRDDQALRADVREMVAEAWREAGRVLEQPGVNDAP